MGTLFAGAPYAGNVASGQCLRIMTGAVMPASLDTVVPLELCRVEGDAVHIEPGVVRMGDNRRRRGEDLTVGRPALQAGRVLRPADLGLVASLGIAEVTVRRRPEVAIVATGDELVPPGGEPRSDQIVSSNGAALAAYVREAGASAHDLGIAADCVNIKGKTGEMLDAIGRGEAMRATVVALLGRS